MIITMEMVLVVILLGIIAASSVILAFNTIGTKKEEPRKEQKRLTTLTVNEVNEIMEYISNEVITNKYEVYYELKDLRIIPNMEEEITNITKDILNAFSDNFKENVKLYYSEEYFITLITRRAQYFLIEYTKKNKPKSK